MEQTLNNRNALSTRELVQRSKAGDTVAFGVLYDRYAPLVRAACFTSTADRELAEDITQEVFLRTYSKISSLREPEKFGGWVYQIAKYKVIEWQRQQKRERRDFQTQLAVIPHNNDQNREYMMEVLDHAMQELPERERMALSVFYLQDIDAEEGKTIMGMSLSGFYKVVDRAKEKLRRLARERISGSEL